MSLNWNLTEIGNYQDRCWVIAEHDDPSRGVTKGDKLLHPVTETIIWGCMAVGLGTITKKNFEKWADRMALYERLFGPLGRVRNEDGNVVGKPLTLEEVEDHIGLRTNVSDETDAKWSSRMLDAWHREAAQGRRRT